MSESLLPSNQPLSEEEIVSQCEKFEIQDEHRKSFYKMGARWAKTRSDEYWKQRLIEETEKAFEAGVDYQRDLGTNKSSWPTETEYITQLKEVLSS